MQTAAQKSERISKRAKVGRGSGNSFGVPLTAAYFTLLVERDVFKSCREALLLENQRIPGSAKRRKSCV